MKTPFRSLDQARAVVRSFLVLATSTMLFGQQVPGQIQPCPENPRYWQYEGRPVILLGGSREDNLFQVSDLKEQLDLLAAAGGNYIRNTMSSRDPGDVQPFARADDGRFDLERWNPEYWQRFKNLLEWTHERDIIVQIEVWDRFDFSRAEWQKQAFNPKNNINYSYEESGFAKEYPDHPGSNKQPFFFTTPKQRNNSLILRYQARFVDEMLKHSLAFPNVLYCMDNETSGEEKWGAYWAGYIQEKARKAGKQVCLTEMWDEWNLQAPQHRRTLDHPERYQFVDVSQNNHQKNQAHWENFQWVYERLASSPRPINTVKTYGADGGRYGSTQDGTERWWRHLIGGAAAVRFHRPDSGIGVNETAQKHIRSARMFLGEFDLVSAKPDTQHTILADREEDEAYATRNGDAIAVYFPQGGEVRLKAGTAVRSIRWLDIAGNRWSKADESDESDGTIVRLKTPTKGHWLAVIQTQ